MAVSLDTYLPFDAGSGANVTEDGWRKMMKHLRLSDGVLRGVGSDLLPFADSTGMQVKVPTGEIFIRGQWGEVTSTKTLPIAAAHATLARIDRVIARNDFVNNRIELDVLTGTAAASPAAPTLTQSSSVWEVRLAQVSVPAADTSIDANQVTDERDTADGPGGLWVASGSQSIGDASATTLQFGTTQRRHPDIVVTGTNNQNFALQRVGLWQARAGTRIGGTGGLERSLNIEVNSTSIAEHNTVGSIGCALHVTKDFLVTSVGDSVRIRIYQDSGGSLSTTSSKTFLSLRWLGY